MSVLTKKKLEMMLEEVRDFEQPRLELEQYITPASCAAEILYHAYLKKDIDGKVVFDLGCGTGRLAIGCALLGAREVSGFDTDEEALRIAEKNSERFGLKISWIESEIGKVKGECDTVVQNPPFGVRHKKADRIFLKKGIEAGRVVYSIHKAETRGFLEDYIEKLGGKITDVMRFDFDLPHSYGHHRKELKRINADVYRIERR